MSPKVTLVGQILRGTKTRRNDSISVRNSDRQKYIFCNILNGGIKFEFSVLICVEAKDDISGNISCSTEINTKLWDFRTAKRGFTMSVQRVYAVGMSVAHEIIYAFE